MDAWDEFASGLDASSACKAGEVGNKELGIWISGGGKSEGVQNITRNPIHIVRMAVIKRTGGVNFIIAERQRPERYAGSCPMPAGNPAGRIHSVSWRAGRP